MHSNIHRNAYIPKLSKKLEAISKGKYKKNRNDIFYILQPYMKDAIKHAKKLDNLNKGKYPSDSTPGTKVYELIEKLLPYLSDFNESVK